jgi:hypothetical protein
MTPADVPDPPEGWPVAANDNGNADSPDPEALRKVDEVVLIIARLIDRRMAWEGFARMAAANDNSSKSSGKPDGEAGT